MLYLELIVIAAFIAIQTALIIFLLRSLTKGLIIQMNNLDNNLAKAIQKVVEEFSTGGPMDQPPFLQQLIGQVLQDKIKSVPNQIKRSDDGKFSEIAE